MYAGDEECGEFTIDSGSYIDDYLNNDKNRA